jgi:polyisoprenoid-binding protein YceI
MKFRIACLLLIATGSSDAATYTLEPDYTQAVFRWEHLGFSRPAAQLAQGTGTLEFDAMNPARSSVKVSIPLDRLATGVPDLDEHLKSEDFFEVAKFPAAVFASTKVEPGMGKGRLKVTGDLTLHGVTKPVTLDVALLKVGTNVRTGIATVGFTATTTIRRSDFGLGAYVPQVSDAIQIELTTQGAEAMAYEAYLQKEAAGKKPAAEKEAAQKK